MPSHHFSFSEVTSILIGGGGKTREIRGSKSDVFLDVFLPLIDRIFIPFSLTAGHQRAGKLFPVHSSYYSTLTYHEHSLRNFVGALGMSFLDHGVYHNASEKINLVVVVVVVVTANDSP
jgi:hypothetical protein